jgi:glycosyltransferase involved in cell wall biosynthesis
MKLSIMSVRSLLRNNSRRIARKTFYRWTHRSFIRKHLSKSNIQRDDSSSPRIFIDISVIAHDDAATGIQRVVRSILHLLISAQAEYENEVIFLSFSHGKYRVIHVAAGALYPEQWSEPDFRPGDIFFGLDYALDAIWRARNDLAALKRRGVRFWFLVHDILPLTHPHWFTRPTVERFHNWLSIIGTLAEGFFCVSADVEGKLRAALAERFNIAPSHRTGILPMGWDLSNSRPSTGLPENFETLIDALSDAPTILMVGTIEPRKGHADVLAAMNLLWTAGKRYNLVLVGTAGWRTEVLQETIARQSEENHRLHWLKGLSDEALSQLYEICTGLIMASHAEGFGLPVVEAIGNGKPVLARNIAPFSSHADKGVSFFPERATAGELAASIEIWLEHSSRHTVDHRARLNGWQDAVDFIGATLLHKKQAGGRTAERSR